MKQPHTPLSVLADKLKSEYENVTTSFPYKDCYRLRRKAGKGFVGFIAAFSHYDAMISGYASWGSGLLGFSRERALQAKLEMSKSFFEKHPEYEFVVPLITPKETPSLYKLSQQLETWRTTLTDILSTLVAE